MPANGSFGVDAAKQAEVVAFIDNLRDQIPIRSETLENELVEAARSQRKVSGEEAITELYELLVKYTRQLPQSPTLELIRESEKPHEALLQDFVWFVTQPLRDAERDVHALEAEIYDIITTQRAMKLSRKEALRDPDLTTRILKNYEETCFALPEVILNLQRRVKALEAVFVDPEGIVLGMRNQLHDLNNILMVQTYNAGEAAKHSDDISRMRYLSALQSMLDETMDLFTYFNRTYSGYEQVTVIMPEEPILLPRPLETRNAVRHLLLNSLKAGANNVTLSLTSRRDNMVLISVVDDVPGGIPEHIRPILGKTYIQHHESYEGGSGYVIICKHLVPRMGQGARITIESPFRHGSGSRVSLIVPLDPPKEKLVPPGSSLAKKPEEQTASVDFADESNKTPIPRLTAVNPLSDITPINGIAAIARTGAPDLGARVTMDTKARTFYQNAILEKFRVGGFSLFKIRTSTPNILTLTYSLKPGGR
jgi:signal transduction histidine kinase